MRTGHIKERILGVKMLIKLLKSKIHGAKVTQAELRYEGSITIDEDLIRAAKLIENEKVQQRLARDV